MKIAAPSQKQNKNASAVLVVIILLGAMLALIASNTANLNLLKRELDLIEQKQLKRQAQVPIPSADAQPNSEIP